jgi:hypothetical protein
VRRSAANAPVRHGRDDEADKWARAASEGAAREGEREESLTSGAGLSGGGRGARGWAVWAVGGEGEKRGRGAGWARMGTAEGGEGFSFFLFSISFFYFGFFLFSFLLKK